jgi:carboxylesterase type B
MPDAESIVYTASGPVQGLVTDEYRLFQGIPYAEPPVGDLRWHSPQPVAPWTEARQLVIEGDVIVVTINYRLGVFGGFGYPGLEEPGTFGLQDQQAAGRRLARVPVHACA